MAKDTLKARLLQTFRVLVALTVLALCRTLSIFGLDHYDNGASTSKSSIRSSVPEQKSSAECCYTQSLSEVDLILSYEFNKEFGRKSRRKESSPVITQEAWLELRASPLFQPPTPTCEAEWNKLVMAFSNDGKQRGLFLDYLRGTSDESVLHYVEDTPGLPRILYLGDSISLGTVYFTQHLFGAGASKAANIHFAPDNCGGVEKYEKFLDNWLSDCPWDLIQFNVGAHYHPEMEGGTFRYRDGIRETIDRLIEHSPKAKIVFATTTPSPFDSRFTRPDRDTCINFDKFHRGGVVPSLNMIARDVVSQYRGKQVVINDRFAAIHPYLVQYQKYCNIHMYDEGYEFLARLDWEVASDLLRLS